MAEALLASLQARKPVQLPNILNSKTNLVNITPKQAVDDLFAVAPKLDSNFEPKAKVTFQEVGAQNSDKIGILTYNPSQVAQELPRIALQPPPALIQPPLQQAVSKPPAPIRFKTRPTSIGNALDVFGEGGVDTLLGLMHDIEGYEREVNDSANKASYIRRLLILLLFIVSACACAISASPICPAADTICIQDINMTSAILNAVMVILLFLHEKIQARNQAPRLRDLSSDFASLGGSVRSAIYSAPPQPETASAFLRSVTARHEELKARALAYGVRRHRTQPV